MDKIWQRDEDIAAIPDVQLAEEGRRRVAARELLLKYQKECKDKEELGEPIETPPKYDLRIWWQDDQGDWSWHKRVKIPIQRIANWKMANLKGELLAKAKKRAVNSDPQTAGNKITEDNVHLMRLPDEGIGVFAGEEGLPGDSMIVLYAGFLFGDDQLAKHKTRANDGTDHRVALRVTRAAMHPSVAGIDGNFVHLPVDGDNVYDLPYYVKNGGGNLLNSRSFMLCNCKLDVEYDNYSNFDLGQLRVDDCYCPPEWPFKQRVSLLIIGE